MDIKIKNLQTIYQGFLTLEKASLQFEKFSGEMSQEVERLNVRRKDAVAILLYDSKRKKVILVEQFRFSAYTAAPDQAWMLETIAGSIEKNASIKETAVREIAEESGYHIHKSQLIDLGLCFSSPGTTSERIYLYAVDIANIPRTSAGGGVEQENEDIRLREFDYDKILIRLQKHEILDAKTIILLQWLEKMLL
jgi:nudix-type nucleoside diphosphatase (YffH/AdpP family)